ncbi:hypothetical protein M422DRAFT_242769 [Sphaerobolus stellatus SS14]|nr:hypothetical protein M422DRAFT_242769 [Sphaerobolus stellatus SS14]
MSKPGGEKISPTSTIIVSETPAPSIYEKSPPPPKSKKVPPSIVSTTIPTIADQLNGGNNYVWIGSAYALSSTAILPLSGSLADIFGRKPIMLMSITFFTVGSAIAGALQNTNMMIAARTIQGIGGGGILNLSETITSDLVSLSERGMYQGLLGLTWSFASGIGPPIAGALAQKASCRWLFYLNLPLSAMSFVFVAIFLRVKKPEGSVSEKLYHWQFITDSHGILLKSLRRSSLDLSPIAAFIFYEAKVAKEPIIPWKVISNRVSFSGYWATVIHGVTSIAIIYYLPVNYQAALLSSPLRSAVQMLSTAAIIAPLAFVAGVTVQVTKRYIPVNVAGWIITIVGFGELSLPSSTSSIAHWVGYQIIVAAGTGIIYSATLFPVMAPQSVNRSASALVFFSFICSFAQAWKITLSSTVLQNQLKKNLPGAFLSRFPDGL